MYNKTQKRVRKMITVKWKVFAKLTVRWLSMITGVNCGRRSCSRGRWTVIGRVTVGIAHWVKESIHVFRCGHKIGPGHSRCSWRWVHDLGSPVDATITLLVPCRQVSFSSLELIVTSMLMQMSMCLFFTMVKRSPHWQRWQWREQNKSLMTNSSWKLILVFSV